MHCVFVTPRFGSPAQRHRTVPTTRRKRCRTRRGGPWRSRGQLRWRSPCQCRRRTSAPSAGLVPGTPGRPSAPKSRSVAVCATRPIRPPRDDGPSVKYRWERTQFGGHWKSTMVVVGGTRPDIVTPTGALQSIPPVVARIEDDGDGTGAEVLRPAGPPPASADQEGQAEDGGERKRVRVHRCSRGVAVRGRSEGSEPFRARPATGWRR